MVDEAQLALKTVILIEDLGSISAHQSAHALGQRLSLPVYEIKSSKSKAMFSGEQWQLVFTTKGLSLRLSSKPEWADIRVDFTAANLAFRREHGGGKKEAIVRACSLHKNKALSILDCTAGMGTDSFVLAANGAQVTMLERQVQIAALLEDGLLRARESMLDIASRLSLIKEDASMFLANNEQRFDVIYLDPMFPHKKKSALVKKEMQAFQKLVGPDMDSAKLLSLALNHASKRVVVKRPSSAEPLENAQNRAPELVFNSKKHRFDVYLN